MIDFNLAFKCKASFWLIGHLGLGHQTCAMESLIFPQSTYLLQQYNFLLFLYIHFFYLSIEEQIENLESLVTKIIGTNGLKF